MNGNFTKFGDLYTFEKKSEINNNNTLKNLN